MTENMAARGEGLAGLVDWLREQSEELMKSAIARESTAETMRAATPQELRSAKALAEKMAGRKLPNVSTGSEEAKIEADVQCRIAAKLSDRARQIAAWADELAAQAAAPAGTAPDTSREALEAAEYALSHPESNQQFALVAVRLALATPSPQAPRNSKLGVNQFVVTKSIAEDGQTINYFVDGKQIFISNAQSNTFSTTSAREQSSATASFRMGVLLSEKIWQLRERGKELAKNPQEYFRGLADGFESLANELEALSRSVPVGEQKQEEGV